MIGAYVLTGFAGIVAQAVGTALFLTVMVYLGMRIVDLVITIVTGKK